MAFGKSCGKIFLVSVNTFFLLLGVALLVIGCLVRFNQDSLVTENAEKLFEAIELDAASDINLKDFLNSVALVFIVSGAFAAIVGLSGCIGACCEVKFLLVVYSIFVLLILAAQIAGVVMMFLIRSDVEKVLKREMKESIQEKYEGDKSSSGLSLAWNSIFLEFDCCGVDNYTDITGGAMWNNTYTQSNNNTVTLMTPITCCKNIQGSVPDYTIPDDVTCAVNPSDSTSNYKKGCYDSVENFISTYGTIFIGIGIAVLVFEILCVVFACCVCRNIEDKSGHAV